MQGTVNAPVTQSLTNPQPPSPLRMDVLNGSPLRLIISISQQFCFKHDLFWLEHGTSQNQHTAFLSQIRTFGQLGWQGLAVTFGQKVCIWLKNAVEKKGHYNQPPWQLLRSFQIKIISDDLHFLGADLLWRFLLVAPGQDNINLGQF